MTSWPMRGMQMAPQFLPAQELRDADPAGAVFILLALAVPVELHLHAAVFVHPDLLAAFPTTRAVWHPTTGRGVARGGRNTTLAGMVTNEFWYSGSPASRPRYPVARALMLHPHAACRLVRVALVMVLQLELVAGGESATVARAARHRSPGLLLLEAEPRVVVASSVGRELAGIIVDLTRSLPGDGGEKAEGRLLEIVVVEGHLLCLHGCFELERGDRVRSVPFAAQRTTFAVA